MRHTPLSLSLSLSLFFLVGFLFPCVLKCRRRYGMCARSTEGLPACGYGSSCWLASFTLWTLRPDFP
ncbi:hypothetical protein M441DRAFT_55986 [Trichoderma asperellum CBS 433.97]|uniref:Uncharacterized protein n=1 Tax=Trichoderma asperellum (strain ATCC 204424 / CBS 433.97 / NBRC 101777) TaxID=1042311 RepID=A0A2T3ZDS0_TRIA4|nr:hypothetical protein M441DRAFT_55986 [Trichoderma asperellum CBS 433.97]PTB42934.1 hypothetical protein M441DRAFT_55986 [Trichoderma asperellum CBS 433.97]